MPHGALHTILPIAGWPAERAESVEFTGGTDPVLPTPFRIRVAGAASWPRPDLPLPSCGRSASVASSRSPSISCGHPDA
jgi:hypothetical protein